MRRQTTSRPQNGYRSYGPQDDCNSSDGPTHTSSSGGTSKEDGPTRLIIRPSSNPISRVQTPEQPASRADSRMAPETPTSARSSFSLNGQQINETYKPRSRATVCSSKPSSPVSPAVRTSTPPPQRTYTQSASHRPVTRNMRGRWALQQELKVKVFGIPKPQWIKHVYFAMSKYGTVIRVDMEPGSQYNGAWVVFQ
jgi:RNA-dependent RNA polymerase